MSARSRGARRALLAVLCSGGSVHSGLRCAQAACGRFEAPEIPSKATGHNGVGLAETFFEGEGPHHVFLIGDWGGVDEEGHGPVPADHRGPESAKGRNFVVGVDDQAQKRVAAQMRKRAAASDPGYILNVGDNFYWGGLQTTCGKDVGDHQDPYNQWGKIFENIYSGPGLDGKQWLGVLGNHDYGGFYFTSGWDQTISYTWGPESSTGRWLTPAQYWSAKVNYPDFSVQYLFVDSNLFNAWAHDYDVDHNICGTHNEERGSGSCSQTGPYSVDECQGWFQDLWNQQVGWMEDILKKRDSDWQIVVTHFPAVSHGVDDWKRLCDTYGIDLIVTGHEHLQKVWGNDGNNPLAPTTHLISGGGGGITSEGTPAGDGHDDMYGFFDLTLTKDVIRAEAISHGGVTRSITEIYEWSVAKKKTKHVSDGTQYYGYDPTTSAAPNAFPAVLPEWAAGGTAWFIVDGGVNRACQSEVEPTVLWGASSIDDCRGLCEDIGGCQGLQYQFASSACMLFADEVWGSEEAGSTCLSYRKGETAPYVETAAPTQAPKDESLDSDPTDVADSKGIRDKCDVMFTLQNVFYGKLKKSDDLMYISKVKIQQALVYAASAASDINLLADDVTLKLSDASIPLKVPKQKAAAKLGNSSGNSSSGAAGSSSNLSDSEEDVAPPSMGRRLFSVKKPAGKDAKGKDDAEGKDDTKGEDDADSDGGDGAGSDGDDAEGTTTTEDDGGDAEDDGPPGGVRVQAFIALPPQMELDAVTGSLNAEKAVSDAVWGQLATVGDFKDVLGGPLSIEDVAVTPKPAPPQRKETLAPTAQPTEEPETTLPPPPLPVRSSLKNTKAPGLRKGSQNFTMVLTVTAVLLMAVGGAIFAVALSGCCRRSGGASDPLPSKAGRTRVPADPPDGNQAASASSFLSSFMSPPPPPPPPPPSRWSLW